MKRIDLVFGTRPEAIKMLPLVRELRRFPDTFATRVIVTAQHRDMLDQVLEVFEVQSDVDLDIMTPDQSLTTITTSVLERLDRVFTDAPPDMVLVHGDTTTTLAASLAAYYKRIPVGHVEAGLRSHDDDNPWPEEMNRRVVDSLSHLHFCPTSLARANLEREGISGSSVHVTGNTGIDGLRLIADSQAQFGQLEQIEGLGRLTASRYVLVTAHRRENFGKPIQNLCTAIKQILEAEQDIEFVYPVHPNPSIQGPVRRLLGPLSRVHLLDPVGYRDFVLLMHNAFLVLTDSGGIQEEAPSLGKPVLVFRRTTERPEAVEAGTVRVIGTEAEDAVEWLRRLLTDGQIYEEMKRSVNPYGDGHASERTVAAIRYYFGLTMAEPESFSPSR